MKTLRFGLVLSLVVVLLAVAVPFASALALSEADVAPSTGTAAPSDPIRNCLDLYCGDKGGSADSDCTCSFGKHITRWSR